MDITRKRMRIGMAEAEIAAEGEVSVVTVVALVETGEALAAIGEQATEVDSVETEEEVTEVASVATGEEADATAVSAVDAAAVASATGTVVETRLLRSSSLLCGKGSLGNVYRYPGGSVSIAYGVKEWDGHLYCTATGNWERLDQGSCHQKVLLLGRIFLTCIL